ncbi:hypothetical protein [Parachlamydia acanthamoebae]|uniref:hypothetical protein n=1 Tax=Parachlamydia acanthamoebae TaxID=83552 RepID=UPI0001C17C60|nr:hypothetical protein [Parachlamydia acanthamoebae]EFB42400.1 hypothetical protein pah_c009o047 [Parachlamydia acanthamoebae str. Hall's coccus]
MRKKIILWMVIGLCACSSIVFSEDVSKEKPKEEVEEEEHIHDEEVADRNSKERDQRSLYLQNQDNVRRRAEMRYSRWQRAQRRQNRCCRDGAAVEFPSSNQSIGLSEEILDVE